jgi:hypothetical protein
MKVTNASKRRVSFVLLNIIRLLLVVIFFFALFEGRRLVFFTSIFAFLLTFLPWAYAKIFKKESVALFDVILILIIFGLFSFWEIRGVYTNFWLLAFLMNFAQAIAIGILGMTAVYTFFKVTNLEANAFAISVFSFCFAFSLGTLLEIGEIIADSLFRFSIHEAGLFGTAGDLAVYFAGSFIVSFSGYFSLKKGKPILVSTLLESFVEKNPKLFFINAPNHGGDHVGHVRELIQKGEGTKVEFKSTLRKNLHTNTVDKQIEHAVLKTVNAYLNSDGGTLLVGVSDKGEILGLDSDQFNNGDHAQRHFVQLVNDHIGAEFLPLVQTQIVNVDGKCVLKVDCKKSDKEAFLKQGKDEHFYVRQGSVSMPVSGSALLRYIESTFRNRE